MLPMEHPWIERVADEFWKELQDKVMMDAEPPYSKQGVKIIWTMRIGRGSPKPEINREQACLSIDRGGGTRH